MNEAIPCTHELILTMVMEEMTILVAMVGMHGIETVGGRLTEMVFPLRTPGRQVPPLIIGADTVYLLHGPLVLP